MGCDIHLHVEVKVRGKWLHYNHPRINRNYQLFAKMAGVRDYHEEDPISPPKGLPSDVTDTTKLDRDSWGIGGHSDSWLSAAEIATLAEWYHKQSWCDKIHGFEGAFGYLFDNELAMPALHPGDIKHTRCPDLEDVRLVFWFDN